MGRQPLLSCDDGSRSLWAMVSCDAAARHARLVAQHGGIAPGPLLGVVLDCRASSEIAEEIRTISQHHERTSVHSVWTAEVAIPCALSLVFIAFVVFWLRQVRHKAPSAQTQSTRTRKHAASRCEAVDALRGLTIGLMVFVNYGGGGFSLFLHSAWDGLTVADVVFPCFAWVMGFTMSIASASAQPPTPWRRVVARSTKLFLLGIFLNNGSSWADWRIPGVLQSLSAGYLMTTCLARFVTHVVVRADRSRRFLALAHMCCGILPLVTVNVVLTFGLKVPGCPTGYLGPGGDSDEGRHRNCTGGAHLFIDRAVFDQRHIYQTPTCQHTFHTGPYDPEGLLNWLMVATTSYAGYMGGMLFETMEKSGARTQTRAFLSVATALSLAAGLVSGGFGLIPRTHWIPLNKNLWSLSYVLASIAAANGVFALVLLCMDKQAARAWLQVATWVRVGRNSIFIYVMHEILQSYAPFSPKPWTNAAAAVPQVVVLLQNVAGVLWWILVAEWLHAQGVFVTV